MLHISLLKYQLRPVWIKLWSYQPSVEVCERWLAEFEQQYLNLVWNYYLVCIFEGIWTSNSGDENTECYWGRLQSTRGKGIVCHLVLAMNVMFCRKWLSNCTHHHCNEKSFHCFSHYTPLWAIWGNADQVTILQDTLAVSVTCNPKAKLSFIYESQSEGL